MNQQGVERGSVSSGRNGSRAEGMSWGWRTSWEYLMDNTQVQALKFSCSQWSVSTVSLQGGFCSCPPPTPGPKTSHLETGNTNPCVSVHSVLNRRHWLKIWEPHIRCQPLQISLHVSDEASPKCSEVTTRAERCENMLCLDWTFAKTLEFNTILGFCPPSACVSAVIEHHALIFFIFLFFSV